MSEVSLVPPCESLDRGPAEADTVLFFGRRWLEPGFLPIVQAVRGGQPYPVAVLVTPPLSLMGETLPCLLQDQAL
jgi:hypothetical protein